MSQQSVLDVQDLYVTFHQDKKSAELVKGVSFSVAPGECLGILGESGSGKSMTAKAMLGLLDRSFEVRGKVFFQGGKPARKRCRCPAPSSRLTDLHGAPEPHELL